MSWPRSGAIDIAVKVGVQKNRNEIYENPWTLIDVPANEQAAETQTVHCGRYEFTSSFSALRSILPVAFLGNSGKITTALGILKRASLPLQ